MNEIDARTSTLLNELLWLAAEAHSRLDTSDTAQRWYQLGQRNTYARAAGIVLSTDRGQDASLVTDRVIEAMTAGTTDPALLAKVALGAASADRPALDWIGPMAFDARYGSVPGLDQDYGMRWGRSGDQRISLRREPGATEGMLYAYDPTWDEYALLRDRVPTDVVDRAFAAALRHGEHIPVEHFAQLVDAEHRRPLVPTHAQAAGAER